ncbi:MAG: hypothetical protein JF608_11825 [Sphingomonadales bacterium]|nr:hypothetical protein [Sphingomonadales bacterium]
MKILFFLAFPLLCAARTLERINSLIVEPMTAQRDMFGRVLAYPWAMRTAEISINRDADFLEDWTFVISHVLEPVEACRSDLSNAGGLDLRACAIGNDRVWNRAQWGKGQLRIERSIVTSRPDLDRDIPQ